MNKNESDWLELLRADLASITAEAARHLWPNPDKDCPPFFNYRLEHVRQVEREALALLNLVGGDWEVVLASVWLHDRFQPAFVGSDYGEQAATWAAEHLAGLGFPGESPADYFYFEPSRRWAAERFEVQRAFHASLCQQVGEPLYSSTR